MGFFQASELVSSSRHDFWPEDARRVITRWPAVPSSEEARLRTKEETMMRDEYLGEGLNCLGFLVVNLEKRQ